jgi:hypothetical protein
MGLVRPCLTLALVLWALQTAHGGVTLVPPEPRGAPSAERLLQKLTTGQPVRVVAVGDSLTDGMELENPLRDTFVEVFAEAVRRRFGHPALTLLRRGVPGETVRSAFRRLERDVLWADPDLVIVQYGGNDFQAGTTPKDYEDDLVLIARRIIEETEACVILCAHPMAEPAEFDSPFVLAAKRAGARLGCPVADLDSAIRRANLDYRGPFPYRMHPRAFTHAVMARALYDAFERLIGSQPALGLQIVEAVGLCDAGASVEVGLRVTNLTQAPQEGQWELVVDRYSMTGPFRLAPGAETTIEAPLSAPGPSEASRSTQHRLFAAVRTPQTGAYDVRWITFGPAIPPRKAFLQPAAAESRPTEDHILTPNGLTIGWDQWRGPWDLSPSFGVRWDGRQLTAEVRVRDDDISPASAASPADGDSVEFYLDLRPEPLQGRPVYDPNVLVLRVLAPGSHPGPAVWSTLGDPPADIEDLRVLSRREEGGYTVRLSVPDEFIERRAGPAVGAIGFDVGANDADRGGGRRTQMMWSGIGDNWLDASRFGCIVREGSAPRLRLTIH